jgi:hypothetical protein
MELNRTTEPSCGVLLVVAQGDGAELVILCRVAE